MGTIIDLLTDEANAIPTTIFRLKKNKRHVVLYGAGYCGHEALKLLQENDIHVMEICDDFRAGELLDGIVISDISDITIPFDTTIFITSGYDDEMKKKLSELGYMDKYMPIDFGRYDKFKENKEYFLDNAFALNTAYNLFSDDKSKEIFIRLINYRISRNLEFLEGICENTVQYFPAEEWFEIDGGYLDLGAFNGDTIQTYLNYINNKQSKIIAVEANERNYRHLCDNYGAYNDIECHNIAISNARKQLRFFSDGSKNSFIDIEGNIILQADSVDNILNERTVGFIKMDIEGAEYEALLGMEKTLNYSTPAMAISVYHKVEDLYRIQLLIEKLCPDRYNYYLRHYSPTVIETVLYAMPK